MVASIGPSCRSAELAIAFDEWHRLSLRFLDPTKIFQNLTPKDPRRTSMNHMFSEAMDSFVVETKNGQVQWNLHSECRKVVIPIADEFGMSSLQFLELYSRHRLPAQLVRNDRLCEERAPAGFVVTLPEEPSVRKRIRRAARFARLSVKDFVWRALASAVNCCEDDMILSPKTGRPIANNVELESFMVKREFDE
jgi:hypothetical protein